MSGEIINSVSDSARQPQNHSHANGHGILIKRIAADGWKNRREEKRRETGT